MIMEWLYTTWYGIILISVINLIFIILISSLLYKQFFKRFYDFILSFIAIIILSPILLVLIIIGAIAMKGNPFFTQKRPGKNEKIFKLIKFRTMTNAIDKNGNLLPDNQRLNQYGKFLRKTSLDELPELINILMGNMSIVGPRPLLVEYLTYYNNDEKKRHNVRPGLTGWAQVNGRNSVDWVRRFKLDVFYVENVSLLMDLKIILLTIKKVITKSDVAEDTNKSEGNFAQLRKNNEI